MPREVILDTQGRAIEQTLRLNNLAAQSCRVGRFVELTLDGSSDVSKQQADKIAKFVLHNPLLETYELIALGEVMK